MSFQQMMTDNIKIIKPNGQEFEDLKASVQSKGIYLMRSDVLVESGDIIQRIMTNGGTETFEVIDPGFHEKFHSIPAHYQMKVRKPGEQEAQGSNGGPGPTGSPQSVTYNLNGPNARINNYSTDNSLNIANTNEEIAEQLELLHKEVEQLVTDDAKKREAFETIEAIQEQFASESPNKVVIKSLISALPHADNIASIGSFLLSVAGG